MGSDSIILLNILQHEAPVKTVHWIKAPNYSCVMTGSWDKTLKVSLVSFFLMCKKVFCNSV